jgi:hypothetical protein
MKKLLSIQEENLCHELIEILLSFKFSRKELCCVHSLHIAVTFFLFLRQVQALNMSLSDSAATIGNLQDRLSQVQRALGSSEQDRRVLQERLDNTR